MKKVLSLIIAILLIVPCFMLNVSAAEICDIALGADYSYLVHNGEKYKRFDATLTEWTVDGSYKGVTYDIDTLKYVDYDLSTNDIIITANIYLTDGSNIQSTYINEKYYTEHNNLLMYYYGNYTVDFEYFEDDKIEANYQKFLGEKTTLTDKNNLIYGVFDVNAYSLDGSFYVKKGALLHIDDDYYFVDYFEAGVKNPDDFNPYTQNNLPAYKITDTELLAELDEADDSNFDLSGFFTGEFSQNVAIVLLSLVFAVMPLVALIIFLILLIRTKSSAYKKLFRMIYIISFSEIVVFAVTVILLTVLK